MGDHCSSRRCGCCRRAWCCWSPSPGPPAGGRTVASGGAPGSLAACNFGVFFPLLAVAVYRLPGGVAAAVGGIQPLLVVALSRVGGRRCGRATSRSASWPQSGVALVVLGPSTSLDGVGVLAALGRQRLVRDRRRAHEALPGTEPSSRRDADGSSCWAGSPWRRSHSWSRVARRYRARRTWPDSPI